MKRVPATVTAIVPGFTMTDAWGFPKRYAGWVEVTENSTKTVHCLVNGSIQGVRDVEVGTKGYLQKDHALYYFVRK